MSVRCEASRRGAWQHEGTENVLEPETRLPVLDNGLHDGLHGFARALALPTHPTHLFVQLIILAQKLSHLVGDG